MRRSEFIGERVGLTNRAREGQEGVRAATTDQGQPERHAVELGERQADLRQLAEPCDAQEAQRLMAILNLDLVRRGVPEGGDGGEVGKQRTSPGETTRDGGRSPGAAPKPPRPDRARPRQPIRSAP
jgi:hypothetical protein